MTRNSIDTLKAYFQKIRYLILKGGFIVPGCEKCEKGYIKKPKDSGFGWDTEICKCLIVGKAINKGVSIFNTSGMALSMLKNYPIENFDDTAIPLEILVNTVAGMSKNTWLYFHGKPGVGKTYAGMVALQYAITFGSDVLYVNVPRLLDDMRPKGDKPGVDIEKYMLTRVVLLDDLGQEKMSDWVKERLYIIFNERYNRRLPTIITSNYSLDELSVRVGHPALISRIKHLSAVVEFVGDDKRVL